MSNLDLADSSKNLDCIERSLHHANDNVKVLGLNEIDRISKQPPNERFSQNVTIAVLNCLENPEEKVGILAVKILPSILPNHLSDHSVTSNVHTLLLSSDLIRCRLYDVFTRIAGQDSRYLESEAVRSVIDRLCTDLDTSDILFELNVVNLLSDLAQTDHGLLYLENKGIMKKIAEKLEKLHQNPLRNLLFPGYMKFFGNVALKQPTKIIQESSFVDSLLSLLLDSIVSDADNTILPVVFDTLGE